MYDKFSKIYRLNDLQHLISYVIEKNKTQADLIKYIKARHKGLPIAYVLNSSYFLGREMEVDRSCLIPRSRTESLVLAILKQPSWISNRFKILDLCCGSGNIGISLAIERPLWDITGVDINRASLEVAKRNSQRYNLTNIRFVLNNGLHYMTGHYDLIVSNPPYLRTLDDLHYSVQYEPYVSLFSGPDGLDHTRHILNKAPYYGRFLALEHTAVNYLDFWSLVSGSRYRVLCSKNFMDNRHMIMSL